MDPPGRICDPKGLVPNSRIGGSHKALLRPSPMYAPLARPGHRPLLGSQGGCRAASSSPKPLPRSWPSPGVLPHSTGTQPPGAPALSWGHSPPGQLAVGQGSGGPGPSHRQRFEAGLRAAFACGHAAPAPGTCCSPQRGRDSLGAVQTPRGPGPTPVLKSTCRHQLPPPDFPPAPGGGWLRPPALFPHSPLGRSPGARPRRPPATPCLCGMGTDPQGSAEGCRCFGAGARPPEPPTPSTMSTGQEQGPALKTPGSTQSRGVTAFPGGQCLGRQGDPTEGAGAGGAKIPPSRTPLHLRYAGTELSAAGLGGTAG